ncbi:MAG: succinate dehydrogenase cytochrome b558 subunit [Planctomycetota bacterium]
MSEPNNAASSAGSGPLAKNHFLLRRLHSLSGIVPIGVFLCEHLFTNAQALRGAEHYNSDVWFIHSLPALRLMEIFLIWLPIAFHAGLGIVYTFKGQKINVGAYRYGGNVRYVLQRVTGMIALVFIFLHLWTVQWGIGIGAWDTPFDATDPTGSTAVAIQFAFPAVLIFYIIGLTACVYHFANGLWTAAISWGLTTSAAAQKRWGFVCAGLGLALTIAGNASAIHFGTMDLDKYDPPDHDELPAHIRAHDE